MQPCFISSNHEIQSRGSVGKVDVEMDKDIQKLILEVSKFEEEDRKNIFSVIEAFVAKRKIQSIM